MGENVAGGKKRKMYMGAPSLFLAPGVTPFFFYVKKREGVPHVYFFLSTPSTLSPIACLYDFSMFICSKSGLQKELFAAPSGEQPACFVAKLDSVRRTAVPYVRVRGLVV